MQNKENKRRFDFLFVLIIIAAFVAIFFIIRNIVNSNSVQTLNFNEVVSYVEDPTAAYTIRTIDATPVGGENYLMYEITGTMTSNLDNSQKSFTAIITYDNLNTLMDPTGPYSNNVTVNITSLSSFSWWSIILSLLPYIITAIIFILLIRFLMRNSGGAGGAFDFAKSTAKISKTKVTFRDVAGCDEEKEELVEIIDFLKNPKKYNDIGARVPKGVLLFGPPGTGKTLLAKAVAGEAGVPFFSISGSDFVEMFVGVGASRVRDMFKTAKENAPCIIFIDEIDAVGRQRGAGMGGGHDERE